MSIYTHVYAHVTHVLCLYIYIYIFLYIHICICSAIYIYIIYYIHMFSYLQCFQPGGSTVEAATVSDFIASTSSPRIKYPPETVV